MQLRQALRAEQKSVISFVGAGGKTTAMFQLARQFDTPVIVTSTTHLSQTQSHLADRHIIFYENAYNRNKRISIESGVTLITGNLDQQGKYTGITIDQANRLGEFTLNNQIPLLVEADGSRQLPLKAPADHEPAIPEITNHAVVLAGLSGLGNILNDDYVHRAEIFSRLTGRKINELVTIDDVIIELRDRQGGLKNIPKEARKSVILNQSSGLSDLTILYTAMQGLLSEYNSIVAAELNEMKIFFTCEKVSGIILAAGGAERFGSPKQLASWNGKTLLRRVTETALASNLSEVIVVAGACETEVLNQVNDLPVKVVVNPNWTSGQASSIDAGLTKISPNSGAAIFLLADQPRVQPNLLNELINVHAQTLAPVIAPEFSGKRGNPVLFDRLTFSNLRSLVGDVGGRGIFGIFPPLSIPWSDDSILEDIDTPEDLSRLDHG